MTETEQQTVDKSQSTQTLRPTFIRDIKVKASIIIQRIDEEPAAELELLLAGFIQDRQIPSRTMHQVLLYAWYSQKIDSETYLFLRAYCEVFRAWDWLHSQPSTDAGKIIIRELFTRALPGMLSSFGAAQLLIDLFFAGGIGAVTATLFPHVIRLLEPNPSYEQFKEKFLITLGRLKESEKESKHLKSGITDLEQWLQERIV